MRNVISTTRLPGAALMAALIVFTTSASHGSTVVLENGNTTATFNTESGDAGVKGLSSLEVDNVDHVNQMWYWFRVGNSGAEQSFDELNQVVPPMAFDLDGEAGNDFVLMKYRDSLDRFDVSVSYFLSGGSSGSEQTNLSQTVKITNLTNSDLDFHLFQYADLNLNNSPLDDAVMLASGLQNTAVQTDPGFLVSETVATPGPTRFDVANPGDLLSLLGDGSPLALGNFSGSLVNVDGAWAFEWDETIAAGQSFTISEATSISPGTPIPEPSTALLAIFGLTGLIAGSRRRKR